MEDAASRKERLPNRGEGGSIGRMSGKEKKGRFRVHVIGLFCCSRGMGTNEGAEKEEIRFKKQRREWPTNAAETGQFRFQ